MTPTNYVDLWKSTLAELETSVSRANFSTWVKDTFVIDLQDETLILGVPNGFAKQWLENKYHQHILEIIQKQLNQPIGSIEYRVAARGTSPRRLALELSTFPTTRVRHGLNPSYTFDSFVVGKSNRLAHAAAQAVSDKPGTVYNPLFVYGGVGLGKTHLIQAIGNAALAHTSSRRILYLSCETFTNEFIEAVRRKKMDEFKQKYREVDVLLIDDIQFIAGKEGTQEEFFHTFNTLYQKGRQIVLTSDRIPQAISDLQKRLSSRFGSGMVADIQTPDLETRQAILRTKAEKRHFIIADEVVNFIATQIQSNIRELEGALIKIISYCQLEQVEPTLKTVEEILGDLFDGQHGHLDPERVLEVVTHYFHIHRDAILSRRRTQELVYPRQIVMFLLRFELQFSYPKIASFLGGKDHTTIIHGCQKIERDIRRNRTLQKDLAVIKERLSY